MEEDKQVCCPWCNGIQIFAREPVTDFECRYYWCTMCGTTFATKEDTKLLEQFLIELGGEDDRGAVPADQGKPAGGGVY